MKQHLFAEGCYPKIEQSKIIGLIWKWVKSPNMIVFEANQAALLQVLFFKKQVYLLTIILNNISLFEYILALILILISTQQSVAGLIIISSKV